MTIRNILMGTTAIVMATSAAQSQSIDYGSLEMMFGEPVTEGATGTPKRASETPINMTIITADEIRRSGARDIPEILRRAAGVDVQRLGHRGAMIGIRGRNHDGQRMRVLINGRDTYRAYEGSTIWDALPVSMEEIRQIEVVRGPSTALYGANAVTGVVNIITFSPMYDSVNTVTATFGDQGHKEVSGVSTIKFGSAGGIRLSGGYVEFDRPNADFTDAERLARPENPDAYRFSGDALFSASDNLTLGFEATYFKGDFLTQNWYGEGLIGTSEDYSLKASMALDSGFGRWTMQAFQNKTEETRVAILDLESGPLTFPQFTNATTNYIDLTNAQSLGSTNVRFTVGYREDIVDQFGGSAADGTGEVGYKTLFASGLADHSFSDKLSLAVSARYDHLDSYRTADEVDFTNFTNDDFSSRGEFSANVGLSYKLSDEDTIKLMYARGFQAPNLFELGGQILTFRIGGNPFVETAIYSQYELQYLRPLTSINGSLSASVFLRKDDNLIGRSVSGVIETAKDGGEYLTSGTIGNAETLGFEFEVKGRTDNNIIWSLQYAFADTESDLDGYPSAADVRTYVREYYDDRSSKHIITGNIGYESDKFSVDALIQYKSSYTSYNGLVYIPGVLDPFRDIDGAWIGNLAAHYQLTDNIKLSLIGEGLFEKLREDHVDPSLATERRLRANLSFSF